MSTHAIILWAIPWFLATMLIEALIYRRSDRAKTRGRGYLGKDTACSLAMGLGNVGLEILFKIWAVGVLVWAYEHRVAELPRALWVWPLLILAEDHCYYWFHRIHHETRFFWAAHVNHHSSERYNLSTALRQSWTTPLTGPLFWTPLAFLGFHPEMIVAAKVVSLLYQYWIHTELIGRLGPLEQILNTPSHHRVHHGRNPQYLDKNYGGIFILFDRLYGTFEPEVEAVEYGLTKNLASYNPFVVAFHEWRDMFRDARRARGLRAKLAMLFRSPAWLAAHAASSRGGSPSVEPSGAATAVRS